MPCHTEHGELYGNFFQETAEKKKEFTNNDGSINIEVYREYTAQIFIEEIKKNKKEQAQRQKEKQKEEQEKEVLEEAFSKELPYIHPEFRTKEGIKYNDYKHYKETRDEDLKQRKFTNFLGIKIKEYYENVKERGFKTSDNKVDIKLHQQFLQEDTETQQRYTKDDGKLNVENYKKIIQKVTETHKELFGE